MRGEKSGVRSEKLEVSNEKVEPISADEAVEADARTRFIFNECLKEVGLEEKTVGEIIVFGLNQIKELIVKEEQLYQYTEVKF